MTTPLFERDGSHLVPTALTAGPWDPQHCHGGATSALLSHLVSKVTTLNLMVTVRLTVELLRPVTRTPLRSSATVLREGRRVQLVRVVLHDDAGTDLATCTALRVREATLDLPPGDEPRVPELPPDPDDLPRFGGNEVWNAGFFQAVDLRLPEGSLGRPGPAAGWIRLEVPVVSGHHITPMDRVAAAADFGNGISAPLPMDDYVFINPDLTVAVDRAPRGEWIGVACRSVAQPTGVGRTVTSLHDRDGRIGTALQSLFIDARTG